jgi:hypothetical protein
MSHPTLIFPGHDFPHHFCSDDCRRKYLAEMTRTQKKGVTKETSDDARHNGEPLHCEECEKPVTPPEPRDPKADAQYALEAFQEDNEGGNIQDLITGLLLLAQDYGQDPNEVARSAWQNFAKQGLATAK